MKSIALLSAADASSTVTSTPVDLGDMVNYSCQVVFSSGTLNGTLKLTASNDNVNYTDVTGSSQVIASGASHVWNVVNATYRYSKVVWTPSSGTGTISATALIKELQIKGA